MQQRSIPWLWIAIGALLLLGPGPAGRLLIDVLGGVTLTLLLLPLLLGGAGWVAWQILKRRLHTCQACGFTAMGGEACPACGTPYAEGGSADSGIGGPATIEIDAREVIIDVTATDVSQSGSSANE